MAELHPWAFQATTALFRVLLAVVLVFGIVPALAFPWRQGLAGLDLALARALWMAFATTVTVHLLVALRIYEAAVFLVLCLAAAAATRWRPLSPEERVRWKGRLLSGFFDLVDGRYPWRAPLARRLGRLGRLVPPRPLGERAAGAMLLLVLAVAAWMRYAEAFTTPAPALSDAPVNLAWLKHMTNNVLYGGEVYPRGMYAVLSLLAKLSGLNGLLVLDVTGPLVGFSILLSLLFFVHRATRSTGAVVVSALVYGTLPQVLPMDFARHAAHNSQEYALIFVLPAAWFAWSYLVNGHAAERFAAAAAAGLAAFTHPVPTLFVIAALGAAGVAACLADLARWRRLAHLATWTALAGAIALTPPILALALGQHWHASSLQYLGEFAAQPPSLNVTFAGLAILALGLVIATAILSRRRGPAATLMESWAPAAALVVVALTIHLLPALGLRSRALADRGGEIAALGLGVAAGLGWALLEAALGRRRMLAIGLLPPLIAAAWIAFPPQPARPYHVFTKELILQYLRADATFTPNAWTLVMGGHTSHALAYGRALHLYVDEFIGLADRMPADADKWLEIGDKLGIPLTPDYLLVVEKEIPLAPFEPPAEALPRLAEASRLRHWIDSHRKTLPLRLVLDGGQVSVWHLQLPVHRQPGDIYKPKKAPKPPARE